MIYALIRNKKYRMMDRFNFRFNNVEVTFSKITIDFTGGTFTDLPFKYEKVQIVDEKDKRSEVIFTGFVDLVTLSEIKNFDDDVQLVITLLSPMKMATLRSVSVIGTNSKSDCVRRIIQPLIDDGFTIGEIDVEDGVITSNFIIETVENCMKKVALKLNLFYYIDEKCRIFIYSLSKLFNKRIAMTLNEKKLKEEKLISLKPNVTDTNYGNVFNFKRVRLVYKEFDTDTSTGMYPIMNINKKMKKGDIITFNNPVIIDKDWLDVMNDELGISKDEASSVNLSIGFKNQYGAFVGSIAIGYIQGEYKMTGDVCFSDDDETNNIIVLQRDSFYNNLITGFKWNGDDNYYVQSIYSLTALRYVTMRFTYNNMVEDMKGIISDSGIVEQTIDYNEKWTTFKQLIEDGKSRLAQNKNEIEQVVLEYDHNPSLKLGDIVDIDLEKLFTIGKFAVKEITYDFYNQLDETWTITLKKSNLLDSFIDLFRPQEVQEETEVIEDTLVSEYMEENIYETHIVDLKEVQ